MQSNKILAVLRHGEADFNFSNDFERQLNSNGKSQLIKLRELLKRSNLRPEKILSSAAVRTTQTAEIIAEIFDDVTVEFDRTIYEAEPGVILNSIADTDPLVNTLLLVGHNPGVSALVSSIADQGYLSMQPGMLVILEVHVNDWKHLGMGTGIVREVLQ
ncbi:phosphohistidine phosphatase [Belliella buryatensis]|uniref:Phosphohistidine phosphatase n=1 Tax=Belliella buryatensis TaxID=1500549 RepID=A0A239C6N3_9BACT|nr:histidine phosphatase family protein [Belliella buryatensis]SNS15328.1 phosphohistidine phosphatase [Belliella buryatensis]